MIDFSFIGKEGLIMQYEDIIAMTGFNIVKYFRTKKVNEKACKMSDEDILLSYLNRESEDVTLWLKNEFGISLDMKDYVESVHVYKPNWLYAYKIFDTAYKNGIRKLIIHSQYNSPAIKNMINTFELPIEYTHGDIVPVLKDNKNVTYMTSLPTNIKRCLEVNQPFALTIVDDFMYVADVIVQKLDEQLRSKNVYVCFTSILSSGLI
jgi:hypothetical protein